MESYERNHTKTRSCAYSVDYKGSMIAVGAFYKAGKQLRKR